MENGRRLRSAWDAEFLLVIDTCQEMYFVYAKIQPYLTDLREKTGMADFLVNWQKVVEGSARARHGSLACNRGLLQLRKLRPKRLDSAF